MSFNSFYIGEDKGSITITSDTFVAITVGVLGCAFFSVVVCCYFAIRMNEKRANRAFSRNPVFTAAQTVSPAFIEAQPVSIPVLYIQR